MQLEILHEDNHLIIVNKPHGILTHGDKTGDISLEEMAKRYVKETYNKPGNVFIKSTHRLDRPVSGALILGRTSKGHERMTRLFRDRAVKKTYWALTIRKPSPAAGSTVQFLKKDRKRNVVSWHDESVPGSRKAITEYRVLGHYDPFYLIELHPITGRSHQLRVLLRSKRCPIAGDIKYGGRKISDPRALLLHSSSLSFQHPVSKEQIHVKAPTPDIEEWRYVMSLHADPQG